MEMIENEEESKIETETADDGVTSLAHFEQVYIKTEPDDEDESLMMEFEKNINRIKTEDSDHDSEYLQEEIEDSTKNENVLKCKFCNKTFDRNIKLMQHTKIHTGEKTFKCNICLKSFTRKDNYRRHMKIHLVGEQSNEHPEYLNENIKLTGKVSEIEDFQEVNEINHDIDIKDEIGFIENRISGYENERNELDKDDVKSEDNEELDKRKNKQENNIICKDKENKQPKYKQLNLIQKLAIIDHVENKESQAKIAVQFGVSKTTVSRVYRDKEKYKLPFLKKKILKNRTRIDTGKHALVEQALFEWMKKKRSLGVCISGSILQKKALFFNEQLKGPESFKASPGWLGKFKKRFGICQINVQEELLSADENATSEFKKEFRKVIEEGQYSLDNVYNANETGLFTKSLPKKTLEHKQSEERVTIMNCVNASGSHKVPLLLVGKSLHPRCFRNISKLPLVYRAQSNAWMDSKIFIDWYQNIFIPSVKDKRHEKGEKFLLLLDNAPCHSSADVLNSIDSQFKVFYIPSNVTSVLQPMDQGVIECMKRHYRVSFLRKLILSEFKSSNGIEIFLKNWTLLNTVSTVANAWSSVPSNALSKSWKGLLGEPIPPAIANGDTQKMTSLLNQFHGSNIYANDDIEEWVQRDANAPVCREISDEELVWKFSKNNEMVGNNETDINEEDEDDDLFLKDDSASGETDFENGAILKEFYKDFTKFKTWYEKRANCTKEESSNLNKIETVVEELLIEKMLKS